MESKPNLGQIQVYWGNGKGKTTAALGLALRVLGRGFNVHLVQFMKFGIEENKDFDEPGEIIALTKFENFSYKKFGMKKWVVGKPEQEHLDQAKKALEHSAESVSSGKFDLVIVDEILYGIQLGLVKEEDVLKLMDSKNEKTELVLTGSHKPFEKIFEKADLVSEIKKHKHPFDNGVIARKGIEF
ncbi:MAG: cob(I)yrinic acid a,c-diamide adenosyltransferase [Candidatus Diapherotrites archaeon]|uniref:Cob(I)yrinic acid a,c-diamide adenosyltransferase n=1 Tax=Candidatus Iainarchaeum sp. TaxID=3101447 RepID=A0A2D6LPH6_9ARCH|nr:cob(I)yrinic acid a,c-diamide adenosyltransferase [Candidatus Diapherotrites archaeon]|tara:strand:+ start:5818 stop:6372 length:555 start_codon:yes stop_codon:yes gene_type:complete